MNMGFLKFFTIETIKDILLHPILQKIWAGGAPMIVEGVKKSLEEHRAEVVQFVVDLEDRVASESIRRRIEDRQFCRSRSYGDKEPYEPGDEVALMNGLTKLYMYLSAADEIEKRTRLFIDLGHMKTEQFDAVIMALQHDVVRQYFRRLVLVLKMVPDEIRTADTATAAKLRSVNEWLEENWSYAKPIPEVKSPLKWAKREGRKKTIVATCAIMIFVMAIVVWAIKALG